MGSELILIPVAALGALVLLNEKQKEEPTAQPVGKEGYYLKFNKDEIFKSYIAIEGHFRNVKEAGIDRKGFMNCAVKHSADAEGHLDEAISHSLIVENEETSDKFRKLRNNTREFRHALQTGTLSPAEGIHAVRALRHEFESFNPEYDISKCEACQVKVEIIKPAV